MLIGKLTKALILTLALVTYVIGQDFRDETIQITYPTTGTMIDTNFVDATFTIADYFDLGTPGCASCDGFIEVFVDGSSVDSIYSADAIIPLTGLSEGNHTLIVEAVDPSGTSFSIPATDTSIFTVNMISVDDLCPPWNFSVAAGDERNYLTWGYPSAEPPAEWYYAHNGTFENAYGSFGGGQGLAQLFMPTGYPATIQSVRFHVSDGGSYTQDIEVNVFADDGTTLLAGPYTVGGDSGWVEVDIDDAVIESGGFLVGTYNVLTGGPYISVDTDNSSASLFFGDATSGWNEMGSTYGIFAEGSHEALISAPAGRAVWTSGASNNNMGDNLPQPGSVVVNASGLTINPIATQELGNQNFVNIIYPPAIEMIARYPLNFNGVVYSRPPNDIPDNDHSREVILGCGDLTNFSIYLSDGSLVAAVDTNFFTHESVTNGTEYCYYVVANYSGGSSTPTETICVTPASFSPPPVTNLYGIGLDEEVALDWTSPDVPQLGVPYSEDFDSELLDLWTMEGDNWFISTTAGNPAPSAYFAYFPTQTNYELSLTSPVLPYSGGGYSLDFDGNNDYVSMPNMVAPSGNDPRTFMAWIKRNNTSTSWPGQAIGGWGNDASNELMNILILDSVLYWHVNGGNSLTGSTQINPDTWYHITATYDGTTQRFFVDGILDGSNDWNLNTGSGNVKFGKQPDWPGAYFDGLINGGAIWNDALTPEEITTIYNSGNPFNVSNDLMAYWDFNDGTGTTVPSFPFPL